MNRGSDPPEPKPERVSVRFNEAPIHESGKCRAGSDGPQVGKTLQ